MADGLHRKLTRVQCCALYAGVLTDNDTAAMQALCKTDLFFLLSVALKRGDVNRDWLFDRCREVEADPDGRLDLWFREGYKSTIITYALTIQNILNNPDITIGIFSHTRPIAKKFLTQIKDELESNEFLKALFPDILYASPAKESPSWSLDNGITVKRSSNPKEKTVEAWGLVDGQPIGAHFSLLVFDDVVTRESVTTPDQIAKTTEAWAMALNLGARGGKRRYIGTRYHFNDTYRAITERKAARPRIYAATHNGTIEGKPVFLTQEDLDQKRREMGPYVFGSQMLQNPIADAVQGFKEDWLRYYPLDPPKVLNKYILVDPASKKKAVNDYTVMAVIGLAEDQNYYLIDGIRDRLNLTQRAAKLFELQKKHRVGFQKAAYEEYGLQADIEHIQDKMERENYRFNIQAVGGQMPKDSRIRRLVPIFEMGRFFLPVRLLFVDCEGKSRDFVGELLRDEYAAFPVGVHDDMMDCLARIVDPATNAQFPTPQLAASATRCNAQYKVL
jgi:predicted phage terminase large subunit-like protein